MPIGERSTPYLRLSAAFCLGVSLVLTQSLLEAQVTRQQLESLAATVSSTNSQHLSELTDAVLSYPRVIEIPSVVKSLIATRVADAEFGYWQGKKPGVRETDIVAAINDLSDTLRMPAEAKTTISQVHEIRIKLLQAYPHLMGLRLGTRDTLGRFHMSDSLSTLQATHLFLSVIDLKFTLPEYQVTPPVWEAARQAKFSSTDNSNKVESTPRSPVRTNNTPETHKLYQGVLEGISNMSDAEGLDLALRMLRHLGVE